MSTSYVPMKSPEFLDEFPRKILLEIAAHVPNRFNLSQVSKQFYDIVCEVEENKKILVIKRSAEGVLNIMDDQLIKSMMNTKRSVEEIKIADSVQTSLEFSRLKLMLLVKFGSFVKKLYWSFVSLSLLEVVKILSLMPLLEDLEIWQPHIAGKSKFEKAKFPVHNIRLKSLKMQYASRQTKKLFRSPSDPDSGKYFSDFICSNLMETLKINLCGESSAAAIALFLQRQPYLKSFIFVPEAQAPSETTLSNYMGTNWPRQLTCLEFITGTKLTDNDFGLICTNLGGLRELRFNCGFAPESVERVRELRHLQKLTVDDGDSDVLPHIRSDSIIQLIIEGEIFDVVQVAENLPNLRKLALHGCHYPTPDVSLFLKSFKHLEELWFDRVESLQSALTNNDGQIYPKMKKFSVGYLYEDPENLLKLLELMPNLEDLDLNSLSFDIGLKKPEEAEKEILRIIEIFTQVKSKVKSFHFSYEGYVRDDKLLTEGLQRVFENLECYVYDGVLCIKYNNL